MPESEQHILQGQTALVTGATSGIGRAIALRLASDGAEVVVHGRDAARGAEVVDEIISAGGTGHFVAADMSDPLELQRLVEEVGQVDILVNNAGFSWFGPTADLTVELFDAIFASNVRAPYFLVAAFAPKMAAQGRGSIINIGSMASQVGLNGGAVYGATKGALVSLTRAWAAEFSASGVRVNTIAAGPVSVNEARAERAATLGNTTLLGRPASVEEIAETVAFLASPRASYITGAIIAADGGRTAI